MQRVALLVVVSEHSHPRISTTCLVDAMLNRSVFRALLLAALGLGAASVTASAASEADCMRQWSAADVDGDGTLEGLEATRYLAYYLAALIMSMLVGAFVALVCGVLWMILQQQLMTLTELALAWYIGSVLWFGWTIAVKLGTRPPIKKP